MPLLFFFLFCCVCCGSATRIKEPLNHAVYLKNLNVWTPKIITVTVLNFAGVVRWCWVKFKCRGVLLNWIIAGQGHTALAVGAGRGCLDIFFLANHFSLLSPSLRETTRYRLKYCLKGPLSTKQPTKNFAR